MVRTARLLVLILAAVTALLLLRKGPDRLMFLLRNLVLHLVTFIAGNCAAAPRSAATAFAEPEMSTTSSSVWFS